MLSAPPDPGSVFSLPLGICLELFNLGKVVLFGFFLNSVFFTGLEGDLFNSVVEASVSNAMRWLNNRSVVPSK